MNEIFEYLINSPINAKFISDIIGDRIEFIMHDIQIKVFINKEMTLQDFKEDANTQYLGILMDKYEHHKFMTKSIKDQINKFKDIFIHYEKNNNV